MSDEANLDLFKAHKADYAAPKKPALIDIAPAQYLVVDGRGAPGDKSFEAKIGALYAAAFTIKMTRKADGLGDYTVCKLEAQWWADEANGGNYATISKDKWRWRLFIRTPDFVGPDDLSRAVEALEKKGKGAEVREVALETFGEGQCVQMLHVGPYDKEGETVEKMLTFAAEQGLAPHGHHHEIYISDPRRVPPERLKTILRHPVKAS